MRRFAGVVLLLGITSCSAVGPRDCTAVGGTSGVSFDLSALAAGPVTVNGCADGVCTEGQFDSTEFGAAVDDAELAAETSIPVSLRVTDAGGAVLFDAAGTTTLRRLDVNGHGCGPIVYRATVVAHPDGTLTTS